jgi:transcription elongation factor Elf1
MIGTTKRRTRTAVGVRTLTSALRTLTRCLVCGFGEVHTDEVLDRGVLLLNECPRCDHRWTDRPAAPLVRVVHDVDPPLAA